VVKEIEKRRLGISWTRRWVRVDLPEPEGAEMMKTVVMEEVRNGRKQRVPRRRRLKPTLRAEAHATTQGKFLSFEI
jgi:hypothetical protein